MSDIFLSIEGHWLCHCLASRWGTYDAKRTMSFQWQACVRMESSKAPLKVGNQTEECTP
jgi:hypothetical protein